MFQTKSIMTQEKSVVHITYRSNGEYNIFQLMEQLRPKTGNPLAIFVLYILLILCHPNISNKFYHGIEEYQLSSQHKIMTVECFLEEHCVRSWSSYGLKWEIPWHFLYVSILLISCLPLFLWIIEFFEIQKHSKCELR